MATGPTAARISIGVERQLRAVAKPARAEHERAYLKSDLDFLGVSVPEIRRVATAVHREHPELSHDDLVDLVDELWSRGIHELRMAAVELLDLYGERLSSADADLLHRLVCGSRTWALVDGLAASVVGRLLERYPEELDAVVRRWAVDDDLWVRRASLLAHLPGLRRGAGDFTRFGELADGMLDEREFFIRKAIGWVLRDTGRRRPELVVSWLEPRVRRASGLTVREAVKHLPPGERARLLALRAG